MGGSNAFVLLLILVLQISSSAQNTSFSLGKDRHGNPLIVRQSMGRGPAIDGGVGLNMSIHVESFESFDDAISAVRLLKQSIVEDSIRIRQLMFENDISGNQIEGIILELKRLKDSHPNQERSKQKIPEGQKGKKPGD